MLVEETMPKLYGVVYQIYPNRDEVYDILQDTFVKAYRALPRLKEPKAFYGWLTRIAINTAKTRVMRRKEWATAPDDFTFEKHPDIVENTQAEQNLEQQDDQRLLQQALGQLTFEQREVVALVELQELNCAEAAEVLDCPAGTVRSRLFYARKKLKKILAPYRKNWLLEEDE